MFPLVKTIIFCNFSLKVLKFTVDFFFSSKNLLSIEQCTWLHLYFPFGKFNSDIHNKMADSGAAFQHEADFDISKDSFVELIYLSGDLKTINCRP